MRYFFLILALLALPLPLTVHAQEFDTDLGVYSSGIFFSDTLVAGERMRLYATIINEGDIDVAGYVEFYQGSIPLGTSQVVSVRAGGVADEVYVDFVVPAGSFNIRAEIKGTDPQDQNPVNDVAITTLFVPILDDDRDDVPNEDDNCVNTANEDQNDNDTDGDGDACDDDDDNDGVTDDVEEELGSNPHNGDSDGDGVGDANDAFPNDPTRTTVPPPAPAPTPNPVPDVLGELFENIADQANGANGNSTGDGSGSGTNGSGNVGPNGEVLGESFENTDDFDPSSLSLSPSSIFSFERIDWNKFAFRAITPQVEGYRYEWDFGDGVSSNRREIEHEYQGSGAFDVKLKIVDPDGDSSADVARVRVPFFTMANPLVLGIIGLLSLLLLLGLLVASRFLLAGDKRRKEEDGDGGDVSGDTDGGAQKVVVRKE